MRSEGGRQASSGFLDKEPKWTLVFPTPGLPPKEGKDFYLAKTVSQEEPQQYCTPLERTHCMVVLRRFSPSLPAELEYWGTWLGKESPN